MTERKNQVFVGERAIIVQLRWVLWRQRARGRSTCNLQISQWQFGAEKSISLKFIALRVEARGDGPFFLKPAFNFFMWIVPTIAKLDKMPRYPARKDKEMFS